ncbi:MAG: heme exporter protein CcmB [Anaerolineae bacterium]|uniref:heme exporter protein CcmB n=1 Tax=Candidatus Amarolinea dominans TaxID=3140696 RepID=UPI003135EF29|nr:heme exporter protein CcmB [Anaerolineae bacterium]
MLGLNRSFALEKDKGGLEGLLLTPWILARSILARCWRTWSSYWWSEAFLIPVRRAFQRGAWAPAVLLIVLLGTIGFAAVGTIFAALAVNTHRAVLLPILLLPVMVPVIIAGVRHRQSVGRRHPG